MTTRDPQATSGVPATLAPPCAHCPHLAASHLPPTPAGRRPRTCGHHDPQPCPCPGYEPQADRD